MVVLGVLLGVLVGTALAVLLDRLYTAAAWREAILPCRGCGQSAPPVAWSGLPGFLTLRGRCPVCGTRLPARLAYLPLLGGLALGLAFARVDGVRLLLAVPFTVALLALTAADIERRLLPNRIMHPTLALALAVSWAWPGRSVVESLAGGAVGFGVMFLFFLVLPGFGFGDVKLAGLLGLLAGLANVLPALLLAAVAAGLGSVVLLLLRRARLRSTVAYGPYLALGAFAGMLAT